MCRYYFTDKLSQSGAVSNSIGSELALSVFTQVVFNQKLKLHILFIFRHTAW